MTSSDEEGEGKDMEDKGFESPDKEAVASIMNESMEFSKQKRSSLLPQKNVQQQ